MQKKIAKILMRKKVTAEKRLFVYAVFSFKMTKLYITNFVHFLAKFRLKFKFES